MVRKLLLNRSIFLGVAQLVARSVRDAEAVGSSPITQTIFLWLQKKQIELGTGASQGANGSSPITQTIFYAPRKVGVTE